MNFELEKYLHKIPPDAFWMNSNGVLCGQSIHGNSYVRYNKAKEQASYDVVDIDVIIEYIKRYLRKIGIITIENPVLNPKCIDYDILQAKFKLEDKRDLIWLKFTKDGYLGVVATSNDINFDIPKDQSEYDKKHKVYDLYLKKYKEDWIHNSSGIIIHKLGKVWNESFVLVFPLKDIPNGYKRTDVEKAVGNMLIDNNVPILDYYSHIY